MKHSESILQNPPVCTVSGLVDGVISSAFCISEVVFRLNAMTAKIIITAMTAIIKYIETFVFFLVFLVFLGIVSPLQHKCCFCRNFRENSI
jgi:hypothetical protein